MALPRPCLDCGRPCVGTRCVQCKTARRFGGGTSDSSASRGYDRQWRKIRLEVLHRDQWICHWCGSYANTVDHVIPLADGGARLDPANLVAACGPCNFGRTANRRKH